MEHRKKITINGLPTLSNHSETVRQLLESKGVQVADLKEETLSLEDAFIGLTGKY